MHDTDHSPSANVKHPFALAPDPAAGLSDPAGASLDLSFGDPARFPLDAFPANVREVVANLAQVYQVPACLPAMSALAVLSGAVGKWGEVRGGYKDKSTRLNLYVVAAAARGIGKGNTSQLVEPVGERERILQASHRSRIADSKAGLGVLRERIKAATGKAAKASGTQPPADLQAMHRRLEDLERETRRHVALVLDNATSEAALVTLQDNAEELFCCSAEAGSAIKVALGKYTKGDSTDFDWLLSAYSGDKVGARRMNRDAVALERPCLSLLWMVQPSVLRELLANAEAQERGLTARMLVFDSKARRQHDNGETAAFDKSAQWNALIGGILDKRGRGELAEITCEAEARAVFTAFHGESVDYGRGAFADFDGELSRWRENAIKVAGLFALAEGLDTITPDTANNACAVVKWCSFNYLAILMAGQRERKREALEKIQRLLLENGGEITMRDLGLRHSVTREKISSIMDAFPDALRIVRKAQKGTQGGRPSEILTMPSKPSKPHKEAGHSGSFVGFEGFEDGGASEKEGLGHA